MKTYYYPLIILSVSLLISLTFKALLLSHNFFPFAIAKDNFNKDLPDPSTSWTNHRIFNIGNSNSIQLMSFIKMLEEEIANLKIKTLK